MNLQPASKGKVRYTQFGTIHDDEGRIATFDSYDGTGDDCRANAEYFAHAANVLPGCVEAMEEAYADIGSVLTDKKMHAALAKLKAALDAARGER